MGVEGAPCWLRGVWRGGGLRRWVVVVEEVVEVGVEVGAAVEGPRKRRDTVRRRLVMTGWYFCFVRSVCEGLFFNS